MPYTAEEYKKWRQKNKTKLNLYSVEYRKKNYEKRLSNERTWKKNNIEKVRSYARLYSKNNKEKMRKYAKKWRSKNKEKAYKYFLNWKNKYHERYALIRKNYHKNNWDKIHSYNLRHYQLWKEVYRKKKFEEKKKVVLGYGGECQCCGEKQIEFLTIDHILRDGKLDRKIWKGNRFYRYLIANNFPREKYRLLCMNCNWGQRHSGICPHKT